MCPVCAVAVGVGLGLSRWLKIADTISGLWIGALIISLSSVSATFTRKYIKQSYRVLFVFYLILFLASTMIPLWYAGIIGHPVHMIYGVDKLVFGITIGMILFLLSHALHLFLKKNHRNKVYFPFQKVIIPVWILLLGSIVFAVFHII
jgi:hypothetical protein